MRGCLAADVGGGSIKMLAACCEAGQIRILDQRSVQVPPLARGGHIYVDVPGILAAVRGYAEEPIQKGMSLQALGIDTFGNGYGLLDERGDLMELPLFYKDGRTRGVLQEIEKRVPLWELYCATGVYPTDIRVLMQLFCDARDPRHAIHRSSRMLLLPDLLNYALTGQMHGEESMASVASLLSTGGGWAVDVLDRLEIPSAILPELVKGGGAVHPLRDTVAGGLGRELQVVTVASHDTESALLAAPELDEHSVFASVGTSIIFGARTNEPVVSHQGFEGAFKTVKGPFHSSLCRDFNAMWLFEKCIQAWRRTQPRLTYEDVLEACRTAKENHTYCNVCDPALRVEQGDILQAIADYCRETGQTPPFGVGETANCVLDSMVLQALWSLRQIRQITGRNDFQRLVAIGGGTRNPFLMQRLADALAMPVVTGSVVSSALGNILMQLYAVGAVSDLGEMQQIAKHSFTSSTYSPRPAYHEKWEQALLQFETNDTIRGIWR